MLSFDVPVAALTFNVYPAGGHVPLIISAEILSVVDAAIFKHGSVKHWLDDRALLILMSMEIQLRLSRQIGLG
ncbi:hypothetical protein D3C81_2127850 [compost metagenome]